MRKRTDDDITRDILNKIRGLDEMVSKHNGLLLEEKDKPDESNVAESPLIYLPDTGNLVFSGVIPCLNNMKWQFVLKTNTGNGCFIWADGMIMSKENMQILNKLFGFYLNWKDQWIMESSDLEKLAEHYKEKL